MKENERTETSLGLCRQSRMYSIEGRVKERKRKEDRDKHHARVPLQNKEYVFTKTRRTEGANTSAKTCLSWQIQTPQTILTV
jgi:hypothetical protein